ncbi:MAG: hypothetical protein ACE141_02770 [Bryobacteraceae bacterium]
MKRTVIWLILLGFTAFAGFGKAQERLGQVSSILPSDTQTSEWRGLAISIVAQGAASAFDAYTSWNRPERNAILADGGRFTGESAMRKAGLLAGVSVIEILVVKKWGKRHPWIARACQIGNFTSAGIMVSAGVRNLSTR